MAAQPGTAAGKIAASFGFAPVCGESARILILGSLPGQTSLHRREYYAQPQNSFWRIMGALFGAGPNLSYAERVQRLIAAALYARHVAGRLAPRDAQIRRERLPSTSPAHASVCFDAKLAAWRAFVRLAKSA
ncbi:MAG: hypothetical protein ABSF94_02815 [Steroidobacteraceae bacterium]